MEYNYIDDIDNIIEDKAKMKELLLFLLKTSTKRYDDYDSLDLYFLFLEIPLDNFITVLNNMICNEYRLEQFRDCIHNFTSMRKVEERKKFFFLLDKNYTIGRNNRSYDEYIFLTPKCENTKYLQYLVEYYEENDDLDVLQKKIENFQIMKNDELKNEDKNNNLYNSIKFIIKFFNNKYIKATYNEDRQKKLKEFLKFVKALV